MLITIDAFLSTNERKRETWDFRLRRRGFWGERLLRNKPETNPCDVNDREPNKRDLELDQCRRYLGGSLR